MNEQTLTTVKYGNFVVLEEGFACDVKWFDDIKNVTDFLRILALKKFTDRDLGSLL